MNGIGALCHSVTAEDARIMSVRSVPVVTGQAYGETNGGLQQGVSRVPSSTQESKQVLEEYLMQMVEAMILFNIHSHDILVLFSLTHFQDGPPVYDFS